MKKKFSRLKEFYLHDKRNFFAVVIIGLIIMLALIDFFSKMFTLEEIEKELLTTAHGMVLDIIVLGLFLTIYESLTQKRSDIKRMKEEIDDFRHWYDPEAMHRIIGNTRRLLKMGVSDIDLTDCWLKETHIEDMDFCKATLNKTFFNGSRLINCQFKKMKIYYSQFTKCDLELTDFSGTYFHNSNFQEASFMQANLSEVCFTEANLSGAKFFFADLSKIKFVGATLTGAEAFESQRSFFEESGVDTSTMKFSPDGKLRSHGPYTKAPTTISAPVPRYRGSVVAAIKRYNFFYAADPKIKDYFILNDGLRGQLPQDKPGMEMVTLESLRVAKGMTTGELGTVVQSAVAEPEKIESPDESIANLEKPGAEEKKP